MPAVWSVFARSPDGRDRAVAVRLLGQIDAPDAARGLVLLALFAEDAEVRRTAAETLRSKDPRDFLGLAIGFLRKPLKYEVRPGAPGTIGTLLVEGERFNVNRIYQAPAPPPDLPRFFSADMPIDPTGASQALAMGLAPALGDERLLEDAIRSRIGRDEADDRTALRTFGQALRRDRQILENRARAMQAVAETEAQLRNDVRMIEAYNAEHSILNERALAIIRPASGVDYGAEPEAWQAWWTDQRGYAYQSPSPERPTFTQLVSPAANPVYSVNVPLAPGTSSCFAAGTPVQTLAGPRPIESIRVGDRVLAQDPRTGALEYRPVVAVAHNPPAETLKVDLGGRPVVATGIHRFWKAGKGWVMARDLRPGDRVRTVGGIATVGSVETDVVQPVFNLEVAGSHSFFVGESGALVHDNSLVQPVPEPFDAPRALAAK